MPKLLITLFVILWLVSSQEALPTLLQQPNNDNLFHNLQKTLSVFQIGTLPTKNITVDSNRYGHSSPPKSLLIVTPIVAGKYPVVVFLHDTCLENYFYSDLLQHISSHGYIVVAPQIYSCITWGFIPVTPMRGLEELNFATRLANWLTFGLQRILPINVIGNLNKLAIGGHGRGGKMAFGLALGLAKNAQLKPKISALIGLDPVEGTDKHNIFEPKILTGNPDSLNLSIPVAVIGTGLGNQSTHWSFGLVCAPNKLNHEEFYNECKATSSHFVTTDYGHMDMLNNDLEGPMGILANFMCKNGNKTRDLMRRTVGGIFVAFLKASFFGMIHDYYTIMINPSVAPATLQVDRGKLSPLQGYAQA